MVAVNNVYELRADAHGIAGLAHAAFQYGTDLEPLTDLREIRGFTLELERSRGRLGAIVGELDRGLLIWCALYH